jgi:hypothetical protein
MVYFADGTDSTLIGVADYNAATSPSIYLFIMEIDGSNVV